MTMFQLIERDNEWQTDEDIKCISYDRLNEES
jgi:hypothetical protein